MNSLNTIIVEGNVVREPVLKATPRGTPVCTFAVMTTRAYKKDEGYDKEVSFFDVDVWGKLTDICMKSTSKGRGVRVVGRLKQSRWKSEDGKNNSKIAIIAEHIEFKPVFKKSGEYDTSAKQDKVITATEAMAF
ncbi:MAG: single-stranded DNA-binding protein [Spirochaetales bacterium]